MAQSLARELTQIIARHPANRGRPTRGLGTAFAWQVYKRTVRRPFVVHTYEGLQFRCYPDSTEPGRLLYFNRLPDYHEMLFTRRFLRPGDHYIDGGAHHGLYTLHAAALVGPTGRVEAVEAAPKAVVRLSENVALNRLSQVVVHAAALADSPGRVPFVVDRGAGSGNRIRTADDVGSATVEVPTITLDDLRDRGPFSMVKLDVEGAEPLAMRGAERLVAEQPPAVWQLELVDRFVRRFGSSAAETAAWFTDRGYDACTYDADAQVLRDDPAAVGGVRDVLFVHREQRGLVDDRLSAPEPARAAHASG